MKTDTEWLEEGTVTSPMGFLAGATYCGIRTYTPDKLDLGILYSEKPCSVAGTFTTNQIKSPSVVLDQERVAKGTAQAIIINSGIANACVGDQGMSDAIEMSAIAAQHLQIDPELVLACSTGLIGVELPMALIRSGTDNVKLSRDGGHPLARAICTTDTRHKECAMSFQIGGVTYTIGGIAKGSGMIHPNMATMLAFLTTDAPVEGSFLRKALLNAVNTSFNMISVDGDTSTNDSVILMSNGAAGGDMVSSDTPDAALFEQALNDVCIRLAMEIARDGEGASKLIEVTIEGAESARDARAASLAIASSTLVKSAIHGGDPNWGRIIVALGYSGASLEENLISLYINDVCIMEGGHPIPFFLESVQNTMRGTDIRLRLNLNMGPHDATAWGCDLSEEYVNFNSEYHT